MAKLNPDDEPFFLRVTVSWPIWIFCTLLLLLTFKACGVSLW